MEYIIVAFLLVFIPDFISAYTASACYGSNGDCNYLHLECSNRRIIQILSAQYLFTKTPDKCKTDTSCELKVSEGCCMPNNARRSGRIFEDGDKKSLLDACSLESSCKLQAPWTKENGFSSSLVEVKFSCINESDKNKPGPAKQDSDNTAVIVVPILLVLLAVVTAAMIFIYWRKKKQRQADKPVNTGNSVLHNAVQNKGYMKTDALNELDTKHPENTYHTIDLNSLPVETADDLGPQDDYNMIDPNKLDYETPANHDYFILEPETGGTNESHNEVETEYNRINLDSNEVVNDPSYHRLGSLENGPGDKHVETHDNYSHIENEHQDQGNKTRTIDEQAKQQQEVLNDDYSHLNN